MVCNGNIVTIALPCVAELTKGSVCNEDTGRQGAEGSPGWVKEMKKKELQQKER